MREKGILIVVSGFSGSGKGTIMKELLKQYDNYALSISATTRNPRPGEEDGREYFFKTVEDFEKMIAKEELIEYARYVDNYYGTPDDGRFPVDMKRLVKKAKETGTLLEVNNSSLRPEGFRENTKENCLEMVRECKAQGVMIVLGSDSHVDADIAEYPYAEEILRETDFPEELVANVSLEKLKACIKHGKKL